MKNLTKLAKEIPKTIGLGLAGAILYGTVGCATMTPAQKTALWGDILTVAGGLNVAGTKTKTDRFVNDAMVISGGLISKQGQMQERLEIANAGKDQIVINTNTNPPNNQNQNYSQNQNQSYNQNQNYNAQNNLENKNNSTPKGLFMYKNWTDFNNDRVVNRDELIGLNESVYNLRNLNDLFFSFYGGSSGIYDGQSLNLKIYSMEDGKTINYFNEICKSSEIQHFPCESKYFPKGGKYKAVLNTGNNKTSSLDFEVIK